MARTEVRGGQILDASVGLTADVTGVLPRANGGTGLSVAGAAENSLISDGTNWVSGRPDKRTVTTASTATLTIDSDATDVYTVTALAAAMTIAAPTFTSPVNGHGIIIRIKDNATARALTWNAIFRVVGVVLPTTTVSSKTMYIGCIYNTSDTKWDVIAVSTEV